MDVGPAAGSVQDIINRVNWLNDFAPVIASVSAVVGLLVAFEQPTAAAKLRRESAFWRESQQAATRKHDQDVMESLHRTATARLIALKMIPARWILFFILVIMNGLAVVYLSANAVGEILPNPITWDSIWTVPADPVLPAVIPVIVFGGLVGIASVFVRRRRVTRLYLDGENVTGLPVVFTDTSIKVGFHLSPWQWVALISLSVGLSGMAGSLGFITGAGTENLNPAQPWLAISLAASMLLLVSGLWVIGPLYHQERESPIHPRAMKPQALVATNDTSPASLSPLAGLWKWLVSRR